MNIDVILTPAELPALAQRDLGGTTCVVFDILRATSTFVTALHNGARGIIPVSEIPEALDLRKKQPDVLLGGERDGVRIRAAQTGGVDFDFGNSPREYTRTKVDGKTIVSTTTNGTRAFRACAGARTVLAGSFLNLGATAAFIENHPHKNVLLVCAGTRERPALEDVLAAGALCELLSADSLAEIPSDATQIAFNTYVQAKTHLATTACNSHNARRLLAIPELRDDVAFCLQRDIYPLVAAMDNTGRIGRI